VELYWKRFEQETGERVEARTMGQWFEGASADDGLWGLLVLTDRSVRFRHQPSDNWFSSFVKNQSRSSSPRGPIEIVVPRDRLVGLEEARRGFLDRLFGPAFPRFRLRWRAAPGEGGSADADEETALFSVDDRQVFLEALRNALPAVTDAPESRPS